MKSDSPIAIFDSGFGGITVLKQLLKLLPNENYIYLGDNANIPYGSKPKNEIIDLTSKMTDFLIKQNCKAIVIACNTIAASAYDILKQKYNIPIIEVISNGAIDAVNNTNNNNISIMATEFTVNSKAYIEKINELNKNIKITQVACKYLCPMIENEWNSYDNRLEVLQSYLKNIDPNSDTLILGCTHYPLIINDIKEVLNSTNNSIKNIIDPAYHTALSVKEYLENNNELNNSCQYLDIYTTESIQKESKLINIFLPSNIYYTLKYVNL